MGHKQEVMNQMEEQKKKKKNDSGEFKSQELNWNMTTHSCFQAATHLHKSVSKK